jgi:choline dehydrogenase
LGLNLKARGSIRLKITGYNNSFEAALGRIGVRNIDVYSDPTTPTCFSLYHRRTVDGSGQRFSTCDAFLPKRLVRHRPNLAVCLEGNVQRITFSNVDDKLTASGVLVEGKQKLLYHVRATREIILSAGAVVTPQLLLLRYEPQTYF